MAEKVLNRSQIFVVSHHCAGERSPESMRIRTLDARANSERSQDVADLLGSVRSCRTVRPTGAWNLGDNLLESLDGRFARREIRGRAEIHVPLASIQLKAPVPLFPEAVKKDAIATGRFEYVPGP